MDEGDEDSAAAFGRYPAPRRPEQPMYSPPSPWPWVIGASVLILAILTAYFVFFIVISGHPEG